MKKCSNSKKSSFEHFGNQRFSKKAQLEIMQSAFALLFVFFILSVAAIFLISQQRQETKAKVEQFLIMSQLKKSMSVALLPEVQYSSDNVVKIDNYDRFALFSFKDIVMANPETYSQMFKNVKLRLEEYDYVNGWESYELFSFAPAAFESKKEFKIPVTLRDQVTQKKTFGVIYLEIYQ